MIAALLRELAPVALASLVRRYRDFEAAEDAVQEALIAAAAQWPASGLPANPRAWLIDVARKRMLDQIRADIARRRREDRAAAEAETEEPAPDARDAPPGDDALLLLFMCCHEALSRTSAIALTLRAVGGLTTSEIARAFLVPEATMGQRISRAKQLVKQSNVPFGMPTAEDRAARLGAVLHVLYLVFNEGYTASEGDDLQRVDLSSEAIRLTRAVHGAIPHDGEVAGLLALMLLTDARRPARTGPNGEIVPLDEQDRSRWDQAMIAEGSALITARFGPGPYRIQAAIAAVHDAAKRPEDTDWPEIVGLYTVLHQWVDNPMIALNRAVAVAMVEGPARGLELLVPLAADPRLANHHRLRAVRAHFHERLGDTSSAITDYRRAAELTASVPERNYLLMKAARIAESPGTS